MISDQLQDIAGCVGSVFSAQHKQHGFLFYVGLFFGLLTAYIGYRHLKIFILRKRLGAELAPWMPQSGWFNSRRAYFMFRLKRDGELVEYLWNIWKGDDENFSVKIGGDTLFVTTDPENLKTLLATQFNDFELGVRHSHFKPLLGDGVFTLDYAGWKHSRALLRPNFSREKISHTQLLEGHIQTLFRHIRSFNGEKFNIQDLFFRLTVDTATEFLFGHSVHGLLDASIGEHREEAFEGQFEFTEAFNRAQAVLSSRAWLQKWYWLMSPPQFHKDNKIVHNFADYYVKKALAMNEAEIEKKSEGGYIFLYELVKQTRDPQVLRDQLLNIMIAGRDTTAGLMSFCFYELAKRPDVWAKLKAEVYEKFGLGKDVRSEEINFESLKKCTYLKYFINEVLRLYPSVPINYRFANKHTTFPRGGGPNGDKPVFVEKGQCIGYVVSATHRNPKYYGADAHVFNPDRWADKNLKPGWAYLPFNGGPRICLGQQFAITEASFVVTRICQEFPHIFDHDPEPERYPPRMVSQLTNSVAPGCWISLKE